MKPICVACQRFYRPKRNGFRFIEGMPMPSNTPPGTAHPEGWWPYKLWLGDLWECQGCGHQLVSGVAQHPLAEHYQPDFAAQAEGVELQVNDC